MLTKAERTRQYIIEKTAPVFNTKGYAGTSLADMTEVTGLTKGSIYGNFVNKDEVALAAFDYNVKRVTEGIRARMQQYTSPLDKLKAYLEFYGAFFHTEYMFPGCPIANTGTEADDTHPLLQARVREAVAFWRKNVETLVQKAVEAGELKPGTEASDFAVLFMSLIEGGVVLAKATGDPGFLQKALKQLDAFIEMHKG